MKVNKHGKYIAVASSFAVPILEKPPSPAEPLYPVKDNASLSIFR
jgi:hypothetical protein